MNYRYMSKKEKREYVKKHFKNPFKVGDIIHHSWGYGQTNCDFYQVVRVTKASIEVRPIGTKTVPGSEGFMSRKAMPVKDNFLAGKFTALTESSNDTPDKIMKRVSAYIKDDGTLRYYIPTPYGWCDKWDGKAEYESWYH